MIIEAWEHCFEDDNRRKSQNREHCYRRTPLHQQSRLISGSDGRSACCGEFFILGLRGNRWIQLKTSLHLSPFFAQWLAFEIECTFDV